MDGADSRTSNTIFSTPHSLILFMIGNKVFTNACINDVHSDPVHAYVSIVARVLMNVVGGSIM